MPNRIKPMDHVYAILAGLLVSVPGGYFSALRKGDVAGFIMEVLFITAAVWAGTLARLNYDRRKKKKSPGDGKGQV